ncbi:MAG: sigma-70 family RNA polymerase sigma factor [Oscillospiraceae bacterium]|nr:sigma-70 family RNA polymerase sigma factor [Oscillospiraceae bacterium]
MSSIRSSPPEADAKPAIIALYEENYKLYYNVAWRYVQNAATAEDVVQNVFTKVLDSFERFASFPREELEKYVMAMVKNEALHHTKKMHDELPIEHMEDRPALEQDEPCDAVVQDFEQELMRAAIKELPERYRLCIEMKYLYELPTDYICTMVDATPRTFSTLLLRAKNKLKDIYTKLERWGD